MPKLMKVLKWLCFDLTSGKTDKVTEKLYPRRVQLQFATKDQNINPHLEVNQNVILNVILHVGLEQEMVQEGGSVEKYNKNKQPELIMKWSPKGWTVSENH